MIIYKVLLISYIYIIYVNIMLDFIMLVNHCFIIANILYYICIYCYNYYKY